MSCLDRLACFSVFFKLYLSSLVSLIDRQTDCDTVVDSFVHIYMSTFLLDATYSRKIVYCVQL